MTNKKENERHLLTSSMKLAELIEINSELLGVLPRIGMSFGFGEESVEESCSRCGVSTATFLLICNVYTFDGYMPSSDLLKKVDVRDIVRYLRGSHSYYMGTMVQMLEDSIEKMLTPCGDKQKKVIWKFFADYREELSKHFEYEENVVFPYVESVLEHAGKDDFTIIQYEENHSNVEEKLADLKNIVMKYLPRQCDDQQIANVLAIIFTLENDLAKHTEIEDGILVPTVNRLEENAEQ